MDISLIIPAYNEEKYIAACLTSVFKHAKGKFKEIIVVDNASTDGTSAVAAGFASVRVIKAQKKGLTHARQAGYEAASSELIAYIDADCRLTPGWFGIVERHFEEHPDSVSLTGSVTYYDGPRLARAVIVALEWIVLPLVYFVVGYITIGGNFIARRDAIEKVGGFDTNISFYGEDADIARRLATVGPEHLRMDLVVSTSMRRFLHEGFIGTCATYTMNFLSHTLFKKSFTHAYIDRR